MVARLAREYCNGLILDGIEDKSRKRKGKSAAGNDFIVAVLLRSNDDVGNKDGL